MAREENFGKQYSYFAVFLWGFGFFLLFENMQNSFGIVSAQKDAFESCPIETETKSHHKGGKPVQVFFKNEAEYDLNYYWVNFNGKEVFQSVLKAFDKRTLSSYPGHIFRVRSTRGSRRLHSEIEIPRGTELYDLNISPCGDTSADLSLWDFGREDEFEGLLVTTPEDCEGEDSSTWSCVHHVSMEEEAARDRSLWGFAPGEVKETKVGKTEDKSYTNHIPSMPRVTNGSGILLMNQTEFMRKSIVEWFEAEKGNLIDHGVVPGGYTNTHIIGIQKLNLDLYPSMHSIIVAEMRQVLQWWTGLKLKHTSTFGLREYKRGSMLINHVDRMDTHIASAVIQVEQENMDEGGGWPLEVLLPAGCTTTEPEECHRTEIYMQPGQMALYEGGKIMHGRPMRLRGERFGNIFSHFAPLDWHGPNYKKSQRGRRIKKHDEL